MRLLNQILHKRPRYLLIKGLQALKILPLFNFALSIKVGEKRIGIPILGGLGVQHLARSESWISDILKSIRAIKEGMLLDFGANIGQFLVQAKALYPSIEYIAFEPNPTCVFYLEHLIKVNAFLNTKIVPAAFSDFKGIADLKLISGQSDDSSASIVKGFRPEKDIVHKKCIAVINLDSIKTLVHRKRIGLIKIDVEGAEPVILEEMAPLIRKNKPPILLEILPAYQRTNYLRLQRQNRTQSILKKAGYEIFRIVKNDHGGLARLERIREIGVHSDLSACDYLAIPKGKGESSFALSVLRKGFQSDKSRFLDSPGREI